MQIQDSEPAAGSRSRNMEARIPTQQRLHEDEIKCYSLLVEEPDVKVCSYG